MNSKTRSSYIKLILLIVVVIIYLIFFRKSNTINQHSNSDKIDHRENEFRHHHLYYTKHARCRMDCRHIDESEIKEILKPLLSIRKKIKLDNLV